MPLRSKVERPLSPARLDKPGIGDASEAQVEPRKLGKLSQMGQPRVGDRRAVKAEAGEIGQAGELLKPRVADFRPVEMEVIDRLHAVELCELAVVDARSHEVHELDLGQRLDGVEAADSSFARSRALKSRTGRLRGNSSTAVTAPK